MLPPIDRPFTQPTTLRLPPITFGAGAVGQVAEEVRRVAASRVLVVTDPGVAGSGVAGHARDLLEAAGITTGIYDRVPPEPSVA